MPSPLDEVAVTGMGLLTPAGTTEEETWKGLLDGRGLAVRDPELAGLPIDIACSVTDFDADAVHGRRLARRLDRPAHLALAAAHQAVADAGLDPRRWRAERVGVVLGVGSNSLQTYGREFGHLARNQPELVSPTALSRSVPNMVPAEVALDLGARGPNLSVSTACASGATSMAVARGLLASGACDIALVGGGESGRNRMGATCFTRLRALSLQRRRPHEASRPFDSDRDGFVLSEGAAVLVLESVAHARGRGARIRALLRGSGTSCDAYHPVAPHPEGAGAEGALRAALHDAGCTPDDVDHVNAHATSTPMGDAAEARALLRVFGGSPPPVTAPKAVLGHALGAAGAIEAALTVRTLEEQCVPPTANLTIQDAGLEMDVVTGSPRPAPMNVAVSNSFGFGGQNTVLVFTTP